MLTRALLLAAGWLVVSFITTLLFGVRLRFGSRTLSFLWLALIIFAGDLWALLTFGILHEIVILTIATFLIGWWWIRHLPNWNAPGQTTWITTFLATFLYLAYLFAVTAFTPLHPLAFVVAVLLFFVELAALLLTLSFTYEGLDAVCRIRYRRYRNSFAPVPGYAPKVSLHLPAYNEPPAMIEATLRSLAKVDYPNYEVLVVDNNTPEEEIWRPLETLCHQLGPNFRCLHLDQWPGYKAGALNFSLSQTALDAEIIGIIDADYQVEPTFLRELVPAFADTGVAFLQTPQDYRGYRGNPFLEACYYGYKYFFEVSMPSRNEHNAIIFAGTMGLIRKSVLQEIGGWDEWCITEDSEASLRILKLGYKSIYINRAYGRGLIPLTFDEFKKQRFRWCFGSIQLLKKHWESLMPWAHWVEPENRLTGAQRYYYLTAGLQWYSDLLNLFFTFFLILGSVLTLLPGAHDIRPLTGPLIVLPVVLLTVGLWRFLWVLRHTLKLQWGTALRTMGNFFSLGWAVTLGSIQGLIQPKGVFLRTSKTKSKSGIVGAIVATQWETAIGLVCATAALLLVATRPSVRTAFLAALLVWQSSIFLAAPLYSLLSIRDQLSLPLPYWSDTRGPALRESRAAGWVLAAGAVVLLGGTIARLALPPVAPPAYSRLQPADISPQQLIGLTWIPLEERGQPTPTLQPTATPLPTVAASLTPIPTATFEFFLPLATPTTIAPASMTPTASLTLAPTATTTLTATATLITTPTVTPEPTNTEQATAPPTLPPLTATPLPTEVPTEVPTDTPIPTEIAAPTSTALPSPIPTEIPDPLPTNAVIPTP